MKAILLVAGQGARLRPLTDDRPKCLVPWQGRPLLEHSVETLRACGISDIVLVGGYRAESLGYLGLPVRVNPDFERTNMVHSLFCAEDLLEGDDVVISYGDIVYRPHVLRALLAEPAPISVVVDRQWERLWRLRMEDPLSDAETLQLDDRGRIRELGGKPSHPGQIQAQYIGLIRVRQSSLGTVRAFWHGIPTDRKFKEGNRSAMYMTTFLQALIDSGFEVKAVEVDGGWLEFDTLRDVQSYEDHPEEVSRIMAKPAALDAGSR